MKMHYIAILLIVIYFLLTIYYNIINKNRVNQIDYSNINPLIGVCILSPTYQDGVIFNEVVNFKNAEKMMINMLSAKNINTRSDEQKKNKFKKMVNNSVRGLTIFRGPPYNLINNEKNTAAHYMTPLIDGTLMSRAFNINYDINADSIDSIQTKRYGLNYTGARPPNEPIYPNNTSAEAIKFFNNDLDNNRLDGCHDCALYLSMIRHIYMELKDQPYYHIFGENNRYKILNVPRDTNYIGERFYPLDNYPTLMTTPRMERKALICKGDADDTFIYREIDISNCFPTIIYYWCLSMGYNAPNIKNYLENRNSVFSQIMNYYDITKKQAKLLILSIFYGTTVDATLKIFSHSKTINSNTHHLKMIYMIAKECKYFRTYFIKHLCDVSPSIYDGNRNPIFYDTNNGKRGQWEFFIMSAIEIYNKERRDFDYYTNPKNNVNNRTDGLWRVFGDLKDNNKQFELWKQDMLLSTELGHSDIDPIMENWEHDETALTNNNTINQFIINDTNGVRTKLLIWNILKACENNIINIAWQYADSLGFKVDCLISDGMLVRNEDKYSEMDWKTLIRGLSDHVEQETGVVIVFDDKDFTEENIHPLFFSDRDKYSCAESVALNASRYICDPCCRTKAIKKRMGTN